jgi:RNA polymerase sigma factor (TIGR02999 family)
MNNQYDPDFEKLYAELRRIAHFAMKGERPNHTLQPTALVHEYLLRLPDGPNVTCEAKENCLKFAPRAMRNILIDWARKKMSKKRDGGQRIEIDLVDAEFNSIHIADFEQLHELLKELENEHPRWASVINMTYFMGLSETEIGPVLESIQRETMQQTKKGTSEIEIRTTLDFSVPTIQRYKRKAKDWLKARIENETKEESE